MNEEKVKRDSEALLTQECESAGRGGVLVSTCLAELMLYQCMGRRVVVCESVWCEREGLACAPIKTRHYKCTCLSPVPVPPLISTACWCPLSPLRLQQEAPPSGVELRRLWFRYDPALPWTLKGISLDVPPGSKVAGDTLFCLLVSVRRVGVRAY